MPHTPGPWKASGTAIYADGSGPTRIAEVSMLGAKNSLCADDNARLIAAAPKLLAALRAVLDCIEVIEGFITEAMDEARTALAEAEPEGRR